MNSLMMDKSHLKDAIIRYFANCIPMEEILEEYNLSKEFGVLLKVANKQRNEVEVDEDWPNREQEAKLANLLNDLVNDSIYYKKRI